MSGTTPLLLLAAVLGLVVGSFLNVVIYRVAAGESLVRPASRCQHCRSAISARHNIPVVGWLVLRGRCAHCRHRISARYPLVEAATGLLFVAMTARFGLGYEVLAYLYLAAIAVALALIDLDVHRLPDAIVLPSYLVAVLLLVPAAVTADDPWRSVRAVVAMCVLVAGYRLIALVYPGGIGFGDVKLAGLLGLYLGWISWSAVVVGSFGAFLLGGVVAIGLLITHRAGRKTAIPFGPAMLAAALGAVFIAAPISHWYGTIAGLSA